MKRALWCSLLTMALAGTALADRTSMYVMERGKTHASLPAPGSAALAMLVVGPLLARLAASKHT